MPGPGLAHAAATLEPIRHIGEWKMPAQMLQEHLDCKMARGCG